MAIQKLDDLAFVLVAQVEDVGHVAHSRNPVVVQIVQHDPVSRIARLACVVSEGWGYASEPEN